MAKRTQTAHMVEAKAYPDEFASDAVEGTIHAIGDQVPPVQVASLTANNRIGKVKLNWKGGTENDLERYRIYIGTTPGFSTANAATDTADTTNYDHSTENYATTYAYKVQPVDYSGNRGPLSDEVTGIPQQSGSYDLSASSVTRNQLVNGEVIRDKIAASAVSSTKIVDGAVTAPKIAGSAVTETKISSNAVTTPKLVANAVEAGKIAASAVTSVKLTANAVTANKIDANAVTSVKIAASAITSNKITAGAVDTLQLAASAVTANKINVAQLSAINAELGTVHTIGNNFYVDSGGTVYAKEFIDTSGQSMVSGGVFQGYRVIDAGVIGADNSGMSDDGSVNFTHVPTGWSSHSNNVPNNKQWVTRVTITPEDDNTPGFQSHQASTFDYVQGFTLFLSGSFKDASDDSFIGGVLTSADASTVKLEIYSLLSIEADNPANDKWAEAQVFWEVIEIPS